MRRASSGEIAGLEDVLVDVDALADLETAGAGVGFLSMPLGLAVG